VGFSPAFFYHSKAIGFGMMNSQFMRDRCESSLGGMFHMAVALLFFAGGCAKQDPSIVQGYIEGEFVYVASPFAGHLETLSVSRGVHVETGAPLFALEEKPERTEKEEAQRRVDQARAELEDAKRGQRPSEIQTIQAQLEQAKAALILSGFELERQKKLIMKNVTSRRDFDVAQAFYDEDRQRVAELEATLQTARLGSREDQITAAQQNLLAQEAALAHADWNLSQKKQFAPEPALVHDTLYREGDWVPEGNPAVVLLPPRNVKVRAFVAQEIIGRVKLGSSAKILVDGVPSPFPSKVTFISPRVEFTPPVIFSRQMREKFSIMIELSVDPETAMQLHPGQPVDVQLSI
jgi:HlyD family secretion protein